MIEEIKLAWLAPDGSPVKTGDVVARFDGVEVNRQLREAESDVASAGMAVRREQVRAGELLDLGHRGR